MVCICILVVMHIVENKSKSGKKSIAPPSCENLSRGRKGQKRTIANLSNCTPQEIKRYKTRTQSQRRSRRVGFIIGINQVGRRIVRWCRLVCEPGCKGIGYREIAGNDFQGKLAMWQVIARVINQGSKVVSREACTVHAAGAVLDLKEVWTRMTCTRIWPG